MDRVDLYLEFVHLVLFDVWESFGYSGYLDVFVLDDFFVFSDPSVQLFYGIFLLLDNIDLFLKLFFGLLLIGLNFGFKFSNFLVKELFLMVQFLRNRLLQKGILRYCMVYPFFVVFYLLLKLLHLSNQRIMLNFHFLILRLVNVDFILKLLLEIEALLQLFLKILSTFTFIQQIL